MKVTIREIQISEDEVEVPDAVVHQGSGAISSWLDLNAQWPKFDQEDVVFYNSEGRVVS